MQHFHHPNVMSLVGVSLECNAEGPCIIMPFMAKGSLLHYLRQEAETLKPSKETDITQVGVVGENPFPHTVYVIAFCSVLLVQLRV